jgi:Lon protease-like protein
MFEPRHHFLLRQCQRTESGFRLVLVVEAEHQKRAETADLAMDGLEQRQEIFDVTEDVDGRDEARP